MPDTFEKQRTQLNDGLTKLNNIDLTKVVETTDETNLQDQAACAGGACEIV